MTQTVAARTTLLALLFEGGLGLAAVAAGWLLGHGPATGIDLSRCHSLAAAWPQLMAIGYGIIATGPLLAALWLIERYPVGPLRSLRRITEVLIPQMFRGASILQLAVVSLAAGVGEELLFRGLIQAGLSRLIGPPHGFWTALLVAAVLFGVCHWLSTTYAAAALVAGLYFGLIFWVTGSLWTPLVCHALYDFIALCYLIRPNHLLRWAVHS